MINPRQTWHAMIKFADDKPLSEQEWQALSWLTMIDRKRMYFGPGNVRWAADEAERADNLAFYRSLGTPVHSDLEKLDAHVITPEEYEEAPEWTDEEFAQADLYEGGKLIRRGRKPESK